MKTLKFFTMIGLLFCSINLSAQGDLSQEDKSLIISKIKSNLTEVETTLNKIVNRQFSRSTKEFFLRGAIEDLFFKQYETRVQVTDSKGRITTPEGYRIWDYFHNLIRLDYDQVVIKFEKIVDDFEFEYKGGNLYESSVTFLQHFVGWKDGRKTIDDYTYKISVVQIEIIEKNKINIKFGDLWVTEIKTNQK